MTDVTHPTKKNNKHWSTPANHPVFVPGGNAPRFVFVDSGDM